ncbi:hypothetical protein FOZ60_003995 [Perkinsus olseni]|uniref:Uncharacterized protein n=1 Tax=Perkinsus olseni TaxID=32597 RepID=A0A7J6NU08_PEROL|nr:hypothetical protein FOZ60_003995 [Perkinsus olseni]
MAATINIVALPLLLGVLPSSGQPLLQPRNDADSPSLSGRAFAVRSQNQSVAVRFTNSSGGLDFGVIQVVLPYYVREYPFVSNLNVHTVRLRWRSESCEKFGKKLEAAGLLDNPDECISSLEYGTDPDDTEKCVIVIPQLIDELDTLEEVALKFHFRNQKTRRLLPDSVDTHAKLVDIVADQWPELGGEAKLDFTYVDDVGDRCLFHRDSWKDAVELARRAVVGTMKLPTINIHVSTTSSNPSQDTQEAAAIDLSAAPKRTLESTGSQTTAAKVAKTDKSKRVAAKSAAASGRTKSNATSRKSSPAEAEVVVVKTEASGSKTRRSSRIAAQRGASAVKNETIDMLD